MDITFSPVFLLQSLSIIVNLMFVMFDLNDHTPSLNITGNMDVFEVKWLCITN